MAGETTRPGKVLRDLQQQGQDVSDLSPVGIRPSLPSYLAELWGRRHFIWMDSRHRVGSQNSRNRLGNLWLVLRPVLDAGMYYVIFGLILQVTRGVDNFAAFVVIGVLMFRSTMRSVSQGPSTLRSGRAMIRAFSFPRAALPISAEIRDALQMVYTVGVMLVLVMLIPPPHGGGDQWLLPGEQPTTAWLFVIPIFALQFLLNLGISFWLSRIGFLLPDITQVMSVIGRVLMYGSGIIFPIDRYLTHPTVGAIVQANPIYQFVHMYRTVLIDGVAPPVNSWLILGAWSVGLLVTGFLFFWAGEATYGEER